MATSAGHKRRSKTAATAGLAMATFAGLLLASCGGGGPSVLTITLYNAQHEQTTNALIAAFTKQTGIGVRVDNNAEDVLTAQVEQEGSRSPADVIYTENSNWLEQLDDRGLLAEVAPSTLAAVPKGDSASNGDWVGVSARVSVLIYNASRLSPSQLPTSVLGLADPKWKGRIELAPSETDLWPVVSSLARAYGNAATLRWLEGLKANAGGGAGVPDNETLARDVGDGTTDLALINQYYYYRLEAEVGSPSVHAKIDFLAPHDPGYVEGISGAAVLKSSTHSAAAQEFLAFITGAQGQAILAHSDSFEYPLHGGVAANAELTPLDQLQPIDFTPAELGTGLGAKALLQAAGLL